jgi:hypothetical protein
MRMQRIALIPCTKKKAKGPTWAYAMYWPSNLFRLMYRYATNHGYRPIILSAKYGMLLPDDVIEPYNDTLVGAPRKKREAWAVTVLGQLNALELAPGDEVLSLLSKPYGEFLLPVLRNEGLNVQEPLQGLGIGRRMAWLKEHQVA